MKFISVFVVAHTVGAVLVDVHGLDDTEWDRVSQYSGTTASKTGTFVSDQASDDETIISNTASSALTISPPGSDDESFSEEGSYDMDDIQSAELGTYSEQNQMQDSQEMDNNENIPPSISQRIVHDTAAVLDANMQARAGSATKTVPKSSSPLGQRKTTNIEHFFQARTESASKGIAKQGSPLARCKGTSSTKSTSTKSKCRTFSVTGKCIDRIKANLISNQGQFLKIRFSWIILKMIKV